MSYYVTDCVDPFSALSTMETVGVFRVSFGAPPALRKVPALPLKVACYPHTALTWLDWLASIDVENLSRFEFDQVRLLWSSNARFEKKFE